MSDGTIKQVIVMRKDLKMQRGKEIAQGSHASMAFLVDRLDIISVETGHVMLTKVQEEWVYNGRFTKVCVQVQSEAELDAVYEKAKAAGLEVHIITDSGATVFHGVPTKTCLAIGPDRDFEIDKITGHLKLY